ncbi:DUF2441 domain-containing protein [Acidovorax sp. NB1]|uniref:DUF2441 domain-containing protein n=1 Tax=Acidovorax sp. NB1 TaxID=1943571 RepID=UPI0010E4FC50|nr:DUF2441 domain-containing protein [Acidovorax sp. NB1]GDY36307.1 hypothetical protein ACINB_21990 [Acidovorax sp. NB1]
MTYFHVLRSAPNTRLLSVGDTVLTAEKKFNPFYERVCDINHEIPVANEPRRLLEFFGSEIAAKYPGTALAPNVKGILEGYVRLLREMEFENVRREYFGKLPSRTRCIWITDSLPMALYWMKRLDKVSLCQIVEVEVEGTLHRADGRHLEYDSSSIQELREAADRYWRGEPHDTPEPELLLEGGMHIARVVTESS